MPRARQALAPGICFGCSPLVRRGRDFGPEGAGRPAMKAWDYSVPPSAIGFGPSDTAMSKAESPKAQERRPAPAQFPLRGAPYAPRAGGVGGISHGGWEGG